MKDCASKRNKEERQLNEHRKLDDLFPDIYERKHETEAMYSEKKLEKSEKIEDSKRVNILKG